MLWLHSPDPPILLFFFFSLSLLFCFVIFPAFLCVFPFSSKDLKDLQEKQSLLFSGDPCLFCAPKEQGFEGQGQDQSMFLGSKLLRK